MSGLITAEQLAKELSLTPATIKRWAQEKIIPCLRLSGKVVRFDPDDVESALKQRAAEYALPHYAAGLDANDPEQQKPES